VKFSNYFADTPSGPIKTTTTTDTLHVANNFSEISNTPPAEEQEGKVTAVAAVMTLTRESGRHSSNTRVSASGRRSSTSRISSKKVRKKKVLIKVLLDSGSDGDLLFHEKGTAKHFPYSARQVPQSWHTSNGVFQTNGRGKANIKFFEYSNSKQFLAEPDIVEYDKEMGKPVFDLIIGCKSMKELGIVLDFKRKTVTIDEIILPMRNINSLNRTRTKAAWAHNNTRAQEPQSTEEATQRMVRILDAKYEKADLQAVVRDNCSHLNPIQQGKLLELLTEFEPLFDGTLGDWRTEPVSFQLKEGVKPYHGRAFPVPRIHKETLMKEVQRQCELGVLEWQPSSEWASPSFIIQKKNQTVRSVSDFRSE
jgi:hypothetical protein